MTPGHETLPHSNGTSESEHGPLRGQSNINFLQSRERARSVRMKLVLWRQELWPIEKILYNTSPWLKIEWFSNRKFVVVFPAMHESRLSSKAWRSIKTPSEQCCAEEFSNAGVWNAKHRLPTACRATVSTLYKSLKRSA